VDAETPSGGRYRIEMDPELCTKEKRMFHQRHLDRA
jgi:hypothetical protein